MSGAAGVSTNATPDGFFDHSSLLVHLDAGLSTSYSGSGSTWTNLVTSGSDLWQGKNATAVGLGQAGFSHGGSTTSAGSNGYFGMGATAATVGFLTIDHGSTVANGLGTDFSFFIVIRTTSNMSGTSYHSYLDFNDDTNLFTAYQGKLHLYNPSLGSSTTTLPDNTRMSLGVTSQTVSGTRTVKLYIDGLLDSTFTATSGSNVNMQHNARYVSIGAGSNGISNGGNEHMAGRMSVVMIYNQTLSANNMLQNHRNWQNRYSLADN